MKKNYLWGFVGLFLLTSAVATASTFKTITIDDDYSDWDDVPVVDSDPVDNAGFVDIATTQIANDNDYLYIRNTFHTANSLGTFLSIDVDEDTSTGFDIFGLGLVGAEAGWQNDFPFTSSTGVFNNGFGMSGEFFGSGAALLAPFADAVTRELAISLDIVFNEDNSPVFPDDTVRMLLWTDQGAGDVTSQISYTLAVPEPNMAGIFGIVAGLMVMLRSRRSRR